jgi:hypothetical protein
MHFHQTNKIGPGSASGCFGWDGRKPPKKKKLLNRSMSVWPYSFSSLSGRTRYGCVCFSLSAVYGTLHGRLEKRGLGVGGIWVGRRAFGGSPDIPRNLYYLHLRSSSSGDGACLPATKAIWLTCLATNKNRWNHHNHLPVFRILGHIAA